MQNITFYRHNRFGRPGRMAAWKSGSYGLTLLLEGALDYTVNQKNYSLTGGDAVFLPEGCQRTREPFDAADYVSFHFSDDKKIDLPILIPGGVSLAVRHLIAVCDEITKAEGLCPRLDSVLRCILDDISAHMAEKDDPLVKEIKLYISENLEQKITLTDVGKAVCFSPNYCQSVFKKHTGRTIIDYLLDIRIHKAMELIAGGEDPLPEVARCAGFEDYNYFSRLFHRRTGYTPTQYKKSLL